MSIGDHKVSSYANIRCIEDVDGTERPNMIYDLLMLNWQYAVMCTAIFYDLLHFSLLYIL
jgi:hypothetical protein